jgi:hypothetical protein
MTPERIRTGIIVSVVVGTLAILILGYVLLKRRINRGIKEGKIRPRCDDEDPRVMMVDKELETGIVQEPLPIYAKDPRDDEKTMATAERGDHRGETQRANRF